MKKRTLKAFHRYTIDCQTQGVQETFARSGAEAESRIKWRMRQAGIFPVTTYWGAPKLIDELQAARG